MPNCEICDQELVEGDFEEKIGICVNCIMIESREMSSKTLLIVFLFFLGGLMFIVTFLQPVLLLLGALISVPFIIHLVGEKRYRAFSFSSLKFLREIERDSLQKLKSSAHLDPIWYSGFFIISSLSVSTK